MQRNIVETVLGAVVLLVAGGFLFFFSQKTDLSPKAGYVINAKFSKIDGLETGSPVRISGVKVGKVLDFSLDPVHFQAIVRMHINSGIELSSDTAAVISSAGLLDGKFMSLMPGNEDDILKAGDTITDTQAAPNLEELLGKYVFSVNNKKGGEEESEATPETKNGGGETATP